ncbi:hypothetical protein DSECCO2_174160 [anaerobic digester metagenome]
MNKRIGLTTFALLIMILLAGCQLAREDGAEKSADKLIGAFVTSEHINLFDMEGFLNDNGKVSGGEILVEGNQQKYNGRLYATRKDTVETTEEGGKYTKTTYEFDGIEGTRMFSPTVSESPDDENSYVMSNSDNGVTDFKINIKYGDYAEGMELEGNIYVSPSGLENEIFINPVYQSKDGQVYLVSSVNGYCYSADDMEDGSLYTQTIADKVTVNNNGNSKEFSTSVKVSIAIMKPTAKVAIIQIDKDNKLLKKEEYKPGEVPKELNADSSTEYIIVESTKTMKSGETKVERTIVSKSDDSLWYFLLNDNRVFVKTYTTIIWNKLEDQAE